MSAERESTGPWDGGGGGGGDRDVAGEAASPGSGAQGGAGGSRAAPRPPRAGGSAPPKARPGLRIPAAHRREAGAPGFRDSFTPGAAGRGEDRPAGGRRALGFPVPHRGCPATSARATPSPGRFLPQPRRVVRCRAAAAPGAVPSRTPRTWLRGGEARLGGSSRCPRPARPGLTSCPSIFAGRKLRPERPGPA